MPRVSVILAAYNAERFLAAAIESVLAQTFGDFELVVIDDGSTDSTRPIASAFAARDDRVRVISRPNTGQVVAAIDGIAASSAPLIARMDADDVCLPHRLERQVAFMDAHPEVVLLGGAYELIDEDDRLLRTMTQPTDDASLQRRCLEGTTPICQPLAMFRRDAYDRAGGYDRAFDAAEDLELWLRLGEVGRLACLPDVLLRYRQHAGSISETRQQRQLQHIAAALVDAWKRRRLPGTPHPKPAAWRSTGDADSRYRQTTRYGWWAWHSGHNDTARAYARAAIAMRPLGPEGWKLLTSGLFRHSPRARAS
jgi:glycosyltransferase involved in cell wall biosynthesis